MTDNGCKGCSLCSSSSYNLTIFLNFISNTSHFRFLLDCVQYIMHSLNIFTLYCNFNYKLCPQISMGFFKTIRLRLINKVFYLLKCSYPCGFTMWHFQHYPAERGCFDLTRPTRNEKTMTIVYSALPLVNSPHLLATMKVFLHPVIFQWNTSRAPKFAENARLPSFNECRSTSESKQAFYKKNMGRIDQM